MPISRTFWFILGLVEKYWILFIPDFFFNFDFDYFYLHPGSRSGSGSASKFRSDPDPDPHQNNADPKHCMKGFRCTRKYKDNEIQMP